MAEVLAGLPGDWRLLVGDFLGSLEAERLEAFLEPEALGGARVFPPAGQRFAALEATSPAAVKVVILGQDPYHGPGQAMGLSFSVPEGQAIPPSLRNIYRELESDLGLPVPAHGDLTGWAEQGVLLLNSVLSVRAGTPASHAGQGWEALTDQIVHNLARQRSNLVFMLWGSHAQRKAAGVDADRHLVLTASHPSPLSAYRGFMGCQHFSQGNAYLQTIGRTPINWQL